MASYTLKASISRILKLAIKLSRRNYAIYELHESLCNCKNIANCKIRRQLTRDMKLLEDAGFPLSVNNHRYSIPRDFLKHFL